MDTVTGKMQALLLLLAFLLPPEAGASEIISGIESKPHSRPYMAHLEIITDQGYVVTCGGFLISQEFVMTEAHCKGRKITVTLGAHDLKQEESTWQKLEVSEQITHPDYNFFTNLNDIMLLKVPLATNESQADPHRGDNPPSHLVYPYSTWENVQGSWLGKNRNDGVGVRYSEGSEVETHGCQGLQPLYVLRPKVTNLCGQSQEDKISIQGVAQGIVSYGRPDGKPPAVFTRISPYVPWINKILKKE